MELANRLFVMLSIKLLLSLTTISTMTTLLHSSAFVWCKGNVLIETVSSISIDIYWSVLTNLMISCCSALASPTPVLVMYPSVQMCSEAVTMNLDLYHIWELFVWLSWIYPGFNNSWPWSNICFVVPGTQSRCFERANPSSVESSLQYGVSDSNPWSWRAAYA